MVLTGSWIRRWAPAALLVSAVAAGTALLWPAPRHSVVTSVPIADLESDLPWSVNPGYVGSQVCAACHAERVAQFQKTNHFLACREPRPGAMPEGFRPGKGTFTAREPGLRFEMVQAGDDFLQTANRSPASGDQNKTATRIAWIYGAGDADEVYFGWHG